MKRKRILSIHVNTGSYQDFLDRITRLGQARESSYVCLANVHMAIEACGEKDFATVVNGADVVAPDGMPLAKAFKMLHGLDQGRIDGMRLMPDLIEAAAQNGAGVYFYGSTQAVLDGMVERSSREHPRLTISGAYSPPFRELSGLEQEEEVARINSSGAQIVFVGLGCPKQELWMARNKGKINAVMIGAGGAFSVYAGLLQRAPVWMQKSSMEWLYRLCKEPRRLWKRYLVTNSTFLGLMTIEMLRKTLGVERF